MCLSVCLPTARGHRALSFLSLSPLSPSFSPQRISPRCSPALWTLLAALVRTAPPSSHQVGYTSPFFLVGWFEFREVPFLPCLLLGSSRPLVLRLPLAPSFASYGTSAGRLRQLARRFSLDRSRSFSRALPLTIVPLSPSSLLPPSLLPSLLVDQRGCQSRLRHFRDFLWRIPFSGASPLESSNEALAGSGPTRHVPKPRS